MRDLYRIVIKPRDGKKSLWILDWNIWDLPKESVNSDVLSAIANAYNLGRKHALQEVSAIDECPLSVSDPTGRARK